MVRGRPVSAPTRWPASRPTRGCRRWPTNAAAKREPARENAHRSVRRGEGGRHGQKLQALRAPRRTPMGFPERSAQGSDTRRIHDLRPAGNRGQRQPAPQRFRSYQDVRRDAIARSEERRVGKSVDLGGRRIIKKKKKQEEEREEQHEMRRKNSSAYRDGTRRSSG